MQLSVLDDIQAKILGLSQHLRSVGTERILLNECSGRVLGQNILNFRDSPPMDVSAMDGYACRLADLETLAAAPTTEGLAMAVVDVALAGSRRLELPVGNAIRIFTGAVVPSGADLVIPRERCKERTNRVVIDMPMDQLKSGWNIRTR